MDDVGPFAFQIFATRRVVLLQQVEDYFSRVRQYESARRREGPHCPDHESPCSGERSAECCRTEAVQSYFRVSQASDERVTFRRRMHEQHAGRMTRCFQLDCVRHRNLICTAYRTSEVGLAKENLHQDGFFRDLAARESLRFVSRKL